MYWNGSNTDEENKIREVTWKRSSHWYSPAGW